MLDWKPGDKLICVNAVGSRLLKDKEYTLSFMGPGDVHGGIYVRVKETEDACWFLNRFRKKQEHNIQE